MLRKRIGIITPASDTVIEVDFARHFAGLITVHTARMYLKATTVKGELKMLEEEVAPAVRRIAQVAPEVIVFGCTSASALLGLEGETRLVRRMERLGGCPCLTITGAAVSQLKDSGIQNLMVLTPYLPEINRKLEATFKEAGLPITYIAGMGFDSDRAIGNTEPQEIIVFVRKHFSRASADGLFLSCTTLRAMETVGQLQTELNVPVLTSNAVAIAEVEKILNH